MSRYDWRDRIAELDAEADAREIVLILHHHEFPWDLTQSEALAQFRTFAVPSIGELLATTGEYTERTQKRFDDTALILGAFIEHDLSSDTGRRAVRRLNHMHGSYDISNGDMLYTLATLAVGPVRWLRRYGWRPLTDHEITAIVHHLRNVGKHMGIKEIPETYAQFVRFYDDYEREHFGYSAGGRSVADATLRLMTTFTPNSWVPAGTAEWAARAMMEPHLCDALGYPRVHPIGRMLVDRALRLRARIVRRMPVRRKPLPTKDLSYIRGYPDGYDVEQLGTFPRGCPA